MPTNIKKRPEVLSPAGALEKLASGAYHGWKYIW